MCFLYYKISREKRKDGTMKYPEDVFSVRMSLFDMKQRLILCKVLKGNSVSTK